MGMIRCHLSLSLFFLSSLFLLALLSIFLPLLYCKTIILGISDLIFFDFRVLQKMTNRDQTDAAEGAVVAIGEEEVLDVEVATEEGDVAAVVEEVDVGTDTSE